MAAPVATSAATMAAGAAVKAGEVAAPVAAEVASVAAAGAVTGAVVAGHAAMAAAETAKDAAVHAKEWAKEKLVQFRVLMEQWVKRKVQYIAERAIDKVPPVVKYSLEDDDMPRCVSRGKDRFVDAMWPHIREEVLWELAVYLDGVADTQAQEEETRGVDCFRAFFRYHVYPFDKGIWRVLRDPVWWIFTLLSIVPLHSISPLSFGFLFLIIDKSDEFQLVQFILSFKGRQFITQGIIRAAAGYFTFLACATAPGSPSEHTCDENGPGVYGEVGILGVAGYLLTCVLVWIAFLLLRCATEKGRSQLKGVLAETEQRQIIRRSKGGFIVYFLWWDAFVLVLCVGACVWVASTRPEFSLDDWAFSNAVFAAQVVHGLLSAPFFFFTLPGLSRVLTHCVPTAYDRKGRCRAVKLPSAVEREREEVKAKQRRAVLTQDEASELWERIRQSTGVPQIPGFMA